MEARCLGFHSEKFSCRPLAMRQKDANILIIWDGNNMERCYYPRAPLTKEILWRYGMHTTCFGSNRVSYYHTIQQNAFKDLDFVGTARAVAKCDFGVTWPHWKKTAFFCVWETFLKCQGPGGTRGRSLETLVESLSWQMFTSSLQ